VKVLTTVARLARSRSGVGATFGVAATNGMMLVLNVLTGAVTARVLGADGRGELAALLLWPQFLGYACAFALPAAVMYHTRADMANKSPIAGAALALSAIGGGVAFVAGVVAMPMLLQNVADTTLLHARALMIFAASAAVAPTLIGLLQAERSFRLYNRVRYVPLVGTLLALVVLAATADISPLAAALAYLLPGVPVFLWLLVWVARNVRPTFRRAPAFARRLLSYSTRAYGGEAASVVLGQVDKIILVNLLAPGAYGVYVVTFSLSRVLTMLATAVAPVLLPMSAGRAAEEVTALTARALSVTTPLVALGAAAFMVLGSPALRWLYGPDFVSGYWVLCCLSAEAAVSSVVHIAMQPYMALNRPGVLTAIQVATLPIIGVAMWWLVPAFGAVGGALALLLGTTARGFGVFLAYRRSLRVSPPPWWPDLRASLAAMRTLGEVR
jgi:O-antigen/teichoic acid export membrane protein